MYPVGAVRADSNLQAAVAIPGTCYTTQKLLLLPPCIACLQQPAAHGPTAEIVQPSLAVYQGQAPLPPLLCWALIDMLLFWLPARAPPMCGTLTRTHDLSLASCKRPPTGKPTPLLPAPAE